MDSIVRLKVAAALNVAVMIVTQAREVPPSDPRDLTWLFDPDLAGGTFWTFLMLIVQQRAYSRDIA